MSIWQEYYGVSAALQARAEYIEEKCRARFTQIERVQEHNQLRVLDCFRRERVAPAHFAPSYGYGYDDAGRDTLEKLFARVFKAQKAIVRPSIASGTHALALALQGVTKKGTRILSASGAPYDTMESILGFSLEAPFSLKEAGAQYRELPLKDGAIDFAALSVASKDADLVLLQRSRGYQDRPSLLIEQIERAARIVHEQNPQAIVFVDNCYGEFVEEREPIEAGADLIAGSLIKNAGGGLAPTGAYIAGREDLIDRIAFRMTAPGIGAEVGSYAAGYLPFYQGLFLAPQTVAQALKGAVFASAMLEDAGFSASPAWDEPRGCVIQSIRLGNKEKLIELCRQIQSSSPVDSFVTPVPAPMPGYADEVIMAAGTFIQGASIELSADAPIREPYILFMQGGLVYAQVKAAILSALAKMEEIR